LLVDCFGVGYCKWLHDLRSEIIAFQAHQQVIMIGHQAIRNDIGLIRRDVILLSLQEKYPVFFTKEYRPSIHTPVKYVVVLAGC
jgi:hypothetical protein